VTTCRCCRVYRTKSFARWLHGTCVEAPPQKIDCEDELFVFSYFSDISTNPDILSLVFSIQQSIKKAIANVARYLMRWKRYRSIWKVDKVSRASSNTLKPNTQRRRDATVELSRVVGVYSVSVSQSIIWVARWCSGRASAL